MKLSPEQQAQLTAAKVMDLRNFKPTDTDRAVAFVSADQLLQHYHDKGEDNLHKIATYIFLNGIAFGRKRLTPGQTKALETAYADIIQQFQESRKRYN